ncbi:hypothetical protein GOBAR_AA28676 [Gossypium barbadense]|uniref:Rieske domain-containing protein n=1 Tax=Gossypium barbadense TaxID=3634 RepID=A0A2P5WLR1_GOSBA|nr:hypothetical protein GOBAR_AA28676 [Gossypium barbadense]
MATAFHHHYNFTPTPILRRRRSPPSPSPITLHLNAPLSTTFNFPTKQCSSSSSSSRITCKATEMSSVSEESAASGGGAGDNWVPVVPLAALPKGERRVIIQDGETILLLWYKDEVFAIENRSPAEGAYTEGLLNAKLTQVKLSIGSEVTSLLLAKAVKWGEECTAFISFFHLPYIMKQFDGDNHLHFVEVVIGSSLQTTEDFMTMRGTGPGLSLAAVDTHPDGCIVCPTTDSTFDLRTGVIKEWYPKNPVLRALTPALRALYVYPVKTDGENIYISMQGGVKSDAAAEIVFSGKAQPGITASDVNVDEVRMVIDEDSEGFGFTGKNELINGKAAIIGFLLLLDFELLTGKGLLKGTGFLDFIYAASNAFN